MALPDFSKIFHQSSKTTAGSSQARRKRARAPAEWRTIYYKEYPRLPRIDLGHDEPASELFRVIKNRRSRRSFSRRPIPKAELSLLLKYSCGIAGKRRIGRAQPSGGARFPIEVYPVVFRPGQNLDAGLYHYHVKSHCLEILRKQAFSDEEIDGLFSYPWVKDSALALVMTAVFWRNQIKYGQRGYRQILLEAGHIGQNVYLVAEALGLKCCALSGTRDEAIEKLLRIDGVTESVIYALAVGG